MYEAKFQKYLTKNVARFAEPEEICESLVPFKNEYGVFAAGVPLFYKDKTLYVDNSDAHTMVIGPTGCKKSRVTVFSTVSSAIEAGESAIINDPKGEIFRKTAARAKEKGMDVYLLNFRNPSKSFYWNPLRQALKFSLSGNEDESLQCINDFAHTVVAPAIEKTNDRYWGDTSEAFLSALALVLMESTSEEYFNLTNLIQLCYEENYSKLKTLLSRMDQTSVAAFGLHTVLDLQAEKTKSCIYSTLLSVLSPFVKNKNLLRMLSDSSFEIEDICKKPTLVYIIYPDEKNSLNFLVNLFLTQCYETFVSYAHRCVGDRLPVRVNFILDEFSNLTKIDNFSNRISEARSKNIRYFLFIQSFGQLKQKYGDNAEAIISNCNNWICFSSKEMEFLEKISKICGQELDYNGIEHSLVSPFQMQYLRKCNEFSEVLVIKQGIHPYVAELPDFDYVDNFRDYKEMNLLDIDVYSKARFFSFDEWRMGIRTGEFRYPFPSAA